jgi:hypothetical protein
MMASSIAFLTLPLPLLDQHRSPARHFQEVGRIELERGCPIPNRFVINSRNGRKVRFN